MPFGQQTEGVSEYIDWAVKNNFGVMDINIPRYVSKPEDMDHHIQPYDERTLQKHVEDLMCYLWDNYLQMYEVEDLFLVGVGIAYLGIKMLLITRGKISLIFPLPLLICIRPRLVSIFYLLLILLITSPWF